MCTANDVAALLTFSLKWINKQKLNKTSLCVKNFLKSTNSELGRLLEQNQEDMMKCEKKRLNLKSAF